jgi:hypothetical protein
MNIIKYATITLMFVFCIMSNSYAESTGDSMAGIGGYAEGYRMGKITKFSNKGFVMKSGEGEMHLGKDSDVWEVKTEKGLERKNPWSFSTSSPAVDVISKYQGKYVWVKYQQAMFSLPNRDTTYTIVDIENVSRSVPTCKAVSNDGGMKSEGARTGRIVKASIKGTIVKTWEIDIHIGGRNFVSMSTDNEGIFNCAIEWLKSGKEVNIRYVQKMINLSFDDTDYRIIKIEGADDL